MASTIDEQLNIYLTDLHAIELQALEQVKRAPKIAGDPEIAAAFEQHIGETERHQHDVEGRSRAATERHPPRRTWSPGSRAWGWLCSPASPPTRPGKLVAHAYSYEHMELAGVRPARAGLAERAGDGGAAEPPIEIEQRRAGDGASGSRTASVARSRHRYGRTGREDVGAQLGHLPGRCARDRGSRPPSCWGDRPEAGRARPSWHRAFEEHLAGDPSPQRADRGTAPRARGASGSARSRTRRFGSAP